MYVPPRPASSPSAIELVKLMMSLKWKPPSENSIDFKLNLRFPPTPQDPNRPDFTAKPAFLLYTWLGQTAYEFFDYMDVTDDEWEQYVPVHYQP